MPIRPRKKTLAALLVLPGLLLAAACGGDLPEPATPTTAPAPTRVPEAPARPVATPEGTRTAPVVGEGNDEPDATAAAALPSITLEPDEMVQGGTAIVYLNEAARSATVTFGGRQYPMLQDGERWWAIIGVGAFAAPGEAPISIVYTPEDARNAQEVVEDAIEIRARNFPVEFIELDPQTASLLQPDVVQNELAVRAAVLSGYTTRKLWSGPFVLPAEGIVSGIFGEGRSYNQGPVTDYHRGTDFIGERGDPVYAAAAGEVVFAENLQIRGNTVIIDHGAGVFTAYAHLSDFAVAAGDVVRPGQRIGSIGATGLVTGPHLHWEVIVRGVEVDGQLWLEGEAVGP